MVYLFEQLISSYCNPHLYCFTSSILGWWIAYYTTSFLRQAVKFVYHLQIKEASTKTTTIFKVKFVHYSKMASWPISRTDGPIGNGCFRFWTVQKSKSTFIVISRYQVVITSRSHGIGLTNCTFATQKDENQKWQEKFQKRQVRVYKKSLHIA